MCTPSSFRSAYRAIALAAGLLISLVAAPARAADLPDVIRFGGFGSGFSNSYGTAILAIAQVKDFLAEEFAGTPVKLEFNYFTGTGPAINEALSNKQLDFAQYGALPNVIGKANGLPTRIVTSYGVTSMFATARSDLPINSIADLKGRRVAVSKGTIVHWALFRALQENGISERDVTILDLKAPDQLAALAAGSADVAFGTSALLQLRDQGIAKVIYTSRDQSPKTNGFGAITVTEEFATKYPQATERVVRGIVRAAAWIARPESRDEAFAIWAKSGQPAGSFKEEFEGVDLKAAFDPLVDDFLISQYRSVVAFSHEQKLIRSDVDVQQWVAPEFLAAALKSLGLEDFWAPRNADGVAAKAGN
jgi:sulfonate transport system substrate-binding protein